MYCSFNYNCTAKSQYWLHKAGTSPEHWEIKTNKMIYEKFNENIIKYLI